MTYKLLKEKDYTTSPWSGGMTTEIFLYPETGSYKDRDFYARISSATILVDQSTFTPLEGIDRFITSLDKPLTLQHSQAQPFTLSPFQVYGFSGGQATQSFGQVKDFNLMVKDPARGELKTYTLEGALVLEGQSADLMVIYSPQVDLTYPNLDLKASRGDSLVLEGVNEISLRSEGKGHILVAYIWL